MKSKSLILASLSILALVMFMSLASAALILTSVNIPSTANHNTPVTVTFNLTADQNYTSLIWTNSVNPSKGSWTTLPTITSINTGQPTLTLTAVFTINEYASGTINDANLTVKDTTTSDIDSLIFSSLTINSSPSLSVSSSTIPNGETSTNITIKNTGNTVLSNIQLTQSGDFTVNFSSNNFNLNAGASQTIAVTITSDLDDLKIGSNSATITATSGSTSASGKITTEKSYCSFKDNGNLDIEFDIENKGLGDETEWFPLDEIEVKINVENKGNEKMNNIDVEWGLYNKKTRKWIIDDKENDFDLKENDDKTITINFKLDDVKEFEDSGDYVFYAKATGEDYEFDGNETCTSDSKSIDVIIEDDFVKLNDLEFTETVSCGAELQVSADVWNIGDEDQDNIYVLFYNKDLGIIDQKVEIGDINAFDSEKLNTILKIPQNAKEKTYTIRATVYDKDKNVYETKDNDESKLDLLINVQGSCAVESKAVVSAVLVSGGQAGKELVVKATITNTGDELTTYNINAAGYAEWASLVELSEKTIILSAGELKEVLMTFKVNKDVSGEKTFDIELVSGSDLIIKQPVQVSIEKSNFLGITGNIISESNWYLWGIGALNIVLIIIIILVAVRFAKK